MDWVIIDAGSRAFQFDNSRYLWLFGADGSETYSFSEEHANIALNGKLEGLRVGDKVEAIPYHCCTCIKQHDELIATRNSKVEKVWKVAGRGMMYRGAVGKATSG